MFYQKLVLSSFSIKLKISSLKIEPSFHYMQNFDLNYFCEGLIPKAQHVFIAYASEATVNVQKVLSYQSQ